MSSTVPLPISISEGNDQGRPPATTVAAHEIEIVVVQTKHPIEQDGAGTSNVVQHIPSVVPIEVEPTLEGTGEEIADGGSDSLNVRKYSQPPEIRLHPDLYNAAVNCDVDLLTRFVKSQGCVRKNMLYWNEFCGLDSLKGISIGDNTVLHIVAASSSPDPERRPPRNNVKFVIEVCKWVRNKSMQCLHLQTRHTSNYEEFVNKVYKWNKSLLMARNELKETPVHCAAKAGNYTIFSRLISFLQNEPQDVFESILLARNLHGETALHEAVRIDHIKIVNDLINEEPRLADIDDAEGVSPLYLATMLNNLAIVKVFTKMKPSLVSCAGPKGQTALHAAVLEHAGITRELLEWNNSLATIVDDLKSTPLHYAASAGHLGTVKFLLQYDTTAAYMADINGLYPIHLAANCGRKEVIKELIEKLPDSDELLDKEGRNFLHTAIISNKLDIILRILKNPSLRRMLNARDYQGNTPLHFASGRRNYPIVRLLISMKMVNLSIMNRDGLTPVDLAIRMWDKGFRYFLTSPFHVLRCLLWTGALPSPRRLDLLKDDLNIPDSDPKKEAEKAESYTRSLGVISVLIATVTFAAIFTLPGGYIADDHANRGSPVLSKKYAFKVFVVADLLAFLLSMFATSLILYAGFANMDLHFRIRCLLLSLEVIKVSIKYTVCAFALAAYTVLSIVNLQISILVCVYTFVLLPFLNPSYWGYLLLALPIVRRLGLRGLFKTKFLPPTRRRVAEESGIWISYSHGAFPRVMRNLFLVLIIFILPLPLF